MDTRERCLWSELRSLGQEDPVVLRGLLDRFYDPVYRYVVQRLADRDVYDRDATLDVCDATFRAFVHRARTDATVEPTSLLELFHQIADEKVGAFLDVVPFTLHGGETAEFDRLLSEKRRSYVSERWSEDNPTTEANGSTPRPGLLRVLQTWTRLKMLRFALVLLLAGLLFHAKPITHYTASWFDVGSSGRDTNVATPNRTYALSNSEREEGRKPWLSELEPVRHRRRPVAETRKNNPEPRLAAMSEAATGKPRNSERPFSSSRRAIADSRKKNPKGAGTVRQSQESGTAFLASLSTGRNPKDASASAQRTDLPLSKARHPRDPQLIHQIVLAHTPSIQDCYKLALRRQPDLRGKLLVRFTIGVDGRVSDAEVLTSTLGEPKMERCVLKRIRRWNDFPAVDPDYGEVRFVQEYQFGID